MKPRRQKIKAEREKQSAIFGSMTRTQRFEKGVSSNGRN
jgi:hypothetical protein